MSFPVKFGTYEVFRIILPGFFCLALLLVTLFLLAPTRQIVAEFSQQSIFLFAISLAGVFLGLVLYAYDHPKRIDAYKKLKMPSNYLKEKLCDSCPSQCENKIKDIGEAIDSYFYVFHQIFSASIQERVYYIGSVYHVLADMRMLSFVFGIIIFLISLVEGMYRTLPVPDSLFGILFGAALILFWLFLHPDFFCEKNKSKGDKYEGYIMKMQNRFIDIEIEAIKKRICKPAKESEGEK
jgi:hypothetical protein